MSLPKLDSMDLDPVDLDLDLGTDTDILLPYDSPAMARAAAPLAAPRTPTPAAPVFAPTPAMAHATAPLPRAPAPAAPLARAPAPAAPVPRAPAPAPAPVPTSVHAAPSTEPIAPEDETEVSVAAHLIQYDRGCCVALPVHTAVELLDRAEVTAVPGAAYYFDGLTRWQGKWIPVLDLHALVHAYRKEHAPKTRYQLVIAYQTAPGQALQHGAIALPVMPGSVQVRDSSMCELPGDSDLWPLVALSCFQIKGVAVPIVDTGRLFGQFHG
jgi:CheW-like domain